MTGSSGMRRSGEGRGLAQQPPEQVRRVARDPLAPPLGGQVHQGGVSFGVFIPVRAVVLEGPHQIRHRVERPQAEHQHQPRERGPAAEPAPAHERPPAARHRPGAEPAQHEQRRQRPTIQEFVPFPVPVQGQEQQGRHRGDEEGLPAHRRADRRQQHRQQQELGQVEQGQPAHQPRPVVSIPLPHPAVGEVHRPGGQVQHHQPEQRPRQAQVGPAQERAHPVHPQHRREQGQQAHGHERGPERGRRQQHPEHGQEPGLAAEMQAEQGIQSGGQEVVGRRLQGGRQGPDPQAPQLVGQEDVPVPMFDGPVDPPPIP